MSKIAKGAFEFIWAHEIANGMFRNDLTGNPAPMTGVSKKPLDPAKVSLLKMEDKMGACADKNKSWQKEVVNVFNKRLWKLNMDNQGKKQQENEQRSD